MMQTHLYFARGGSKRNKHLLSCEHLRPDLDSMSAADSPRTVSSKVPESFVHVVVQSKEVAPGSRASD